KYDDWSLPKGKRDPAETDEQCAVREVYEETGLRCHLEDELLPTAYTDARGRDKVVRYWSMTVEGERPFVAGEEIDGGRVHAVDAAVLGRGEATVSAARLSDALEAVGQGVVICDDNGDVVTRNAAATAFEAERYGDGPVGSIVDELLQRAIAGKTDKRT